MRGVGAVSILPLERICWIIVILSVVTVFLVPTGFGSYCAVNRLTTVFKSIQQADAVKAAISAIVLLAIRPLVSMILGLNIATSDTSISGCIGILEKYCVRLC
jgi:hypothetical protein